MSFSYAGDSAAAAFVAGAFNDALDNADVTSASSNTRFQAGFNFSGGVPSLLNNPAIGDLDSFPTLFARINDRVGSRYLSYEAFVEQARALDPVTGLKQFKVRLSQDIGAFFDLYFPDLAAVYGRAEQELRDGVQYGNLTIRRSTETMKWGQARDEILRKLEEQENAVLSKWSALRYRRPPGAATAELLKIRGEAQRNIAEASTEVSAKTFEREMNAYRGIIENALTLRTEAMRRVGEMMVRWCDAYYKRDTEDADEVSAHERQLWDTFHTFTDAELSALKFVLQLRAKYQEALKSELDEPVKRRIKALEKQEEAMLADAKRLSAMAQTAFNVLQGGASYKGAESD